MPLTTSDLANIRSNFTSVKSVTDTSTIVSSAISGITAKINDPIGSVLATTMSSVNSLTASINSKLDKLQKNIIESVDNTSGVKLINNKIVVTLNAVDADKLPIYQAKIQGEIDSIKASLNKLRVVTTSLDIVTQTTKTLKTAMDVQEVLLTVGNPVAKATITLLKKAIKILNYKDVLNSYTEILTSQLSVNKQVVNTLSEKLNNISVEFVINNDLNKGVTTPESEVQLQLRDVNLTKNGGNTPQDYTSNSGKNFILTVETYGSKELIGRARDKVSSLLVVETAPSFISTPDQLIEELKVILNL